MKLSKPYNYNNLYLPKPISSKKVEQLNMTEIHSPSYVQSSSERRDRTITYYKYRFPVEFWERKNGHKVPTLFCTLTIDTFDWKVLVDVHTMAGTTYADFYCAELTDENKSTYPMLSRIHKKIQQELKVLGVVHRKERRGQIDGDEHKLHRGSTRKDQETPSKARRYKCEDKKAGGTRNSNKDSRKRRTVPGKVLQTDS